MIKYHSAKNMCADLSHFLKLEKTGKLYSLSGEKFIDEKIGGFRIWSNYIIAAAPGIGKTSFACQLATQFLMHNEEKNANDAVLFISLEMRREEIYNKMISSHFQTSLGKLTKDINIEVQGLGELLGAFEKLPLFIVDPTMLPEKNEFNVNTIEAIIKDIKANYNKNVRLLVIDYIQKFEIKNNMLPVDNISEYSKNIKKLATRHNLTAITLSQLNRTNRDNKKSPTMADLKGSSSLEQDADVILVLKDMNENEINEGFSDKKVLKCFCLKNRYGVTFSTDLLYTGSSSSFKEI